MGLERSALSRYLNGTRPMPDGMEALNQPYRVPVQVVIENADTILKVLTFGHHVGRQKYSDFIPGDARLEMGENLLTTFAAPSLLTLPDNLAMSECFPPGFNCSKR